MGSSQPIEAPKIAGNNESNGGGHREWNRGVLWQTQTDTMKASGDNLRPSRDFGLDASLKEQVERLFCGCEVSNGKL